jgi:hypothetical protein
MEDKRRSMRIGEGVASVVKSVWVICCIISLRSLAGDCPEGDMAQIKAWRNKPLSGGERNEACGENRNRGSEGVADRSNIV